MSISFRTGAARDIRSIDAALRGYHPRSAAKFAAALGRVLRRLKRLPLSGAELGPSTDGTVIFRSAIVQGYTFVVIHLPRPDGVEVIRVVDGRRDLDAILAGLSP